MIGLLLPLPTAVLGFLSRLRASTGPNRYSSLLLMAYMRNSQAPGDSGGATERANRFFSLPTLCFFLRRLGPTSQRGNDTNHEIRSKEECRTKKAGRRPGKFAPSRTSQVLFHRQPMVPRALDLGCEFNFHPIYRFAETL